LLDHRTYSSTNHGKIVGGKVVIDLLPSITRANGNRLLIHGKLFLVQIDHIDSNAAFNTRGAGKGCMASAFDCEGALCKACEQY
jgi:hypothetical protein